MPQPSGSSLHTSAVLTNLSIAYQQSQNFVADTIFPVVGVQKQFDLFNKYKKGEWFRATTETRRAPSTESVGTGFTVDQDSYSCDVYALHKDIDDQARANADGTWNLERDSTQLVTNDLLLGREIQWFANFFKTGVWATEATATTATSSVPSTGFTSFDTTTGDPVFDMAIQQQRIEESTGRTPNTFVVSPRVHLALINHPAIIERIKYTQRGFVTADLLAGAFNVDRYIVGKAIKNTATETAAATGSSMSFVSPEGALLAYVDPNPGLMSVTAGLTFAWNGYQNNAFGTRVKKFRMEAIESDRIEASLAYDMKVVCSDLAVWFNNPLINT